MQRNINLVDYTFRSINEVIALHICLQAVFTNWVPFEMAATDTPEGDRFLWRVVGHKDCLNHVKDFSFTYLLSSADTPIFFFQL